ncbi:MAG: CBS domain-containing protein [Acidobacteria bacterium]|nr:CBS domain-containing protein [Acidobacteriota bacterium]
MPQDATGSYSRKRCREIMTSDVVTATPDMSLREVAVMMRDSDVGALPIIESGRLVGIVTDRDMVVRAVADGKDAETPVGDVISRELFTVGPDDFVFEAARLMGDKQVRRIPVVEADGSLAGIIAMADVALQMEDEREIAETLEEISSGLSFWNKE